MGFREMRRHAQLLEKEECDEVLTKEKRGVLAVNGEDGYPYALPINYFFDSETGKIYFHSAKEGHKIDALKKDAKVSFTVYEQGVREEDWSYHARSVIIFGKVRFISDYLETVSLVRKLARKYYPEEESQQVENDIMKNAPRVQMIELTPDHITGKRVHEK